MAGWMTGRGWNLGAACGGVNRCLIKSRFTLVTFTPSFSMILCNQLGSSLSGSNTREEHKRHSIVQVAPNGHHFQNRWRLLARLCRPCRTASLLDYADTFTQREEGDIQERSNRPIAVQLATKIPRQILPP